MSNAAEQFKKDFPTTTWSVSYYKQYGLYMKSDEDDNVEVSWVREGMYDYRNEYIPSRYGGGIYGEVYNRKGKMIERHINGDPLSLPE